MTRLRRDSTRDDNSHLSFSLSHSHLPTEDFRTQASRVSTSTDRNSNRVTLERLNFDQRKLEPESLECRNVRNVEIRVRKTSALETPPNAPLLRRVAGPPAFALLLAATKLQPTSPLRLSSASFEFAMNVCLSHNLIAYRLLACFLIYIVTNAMGQKGGGEFAGRRAPSAAVTYSIA